jgi:hypothetical protein
MKLKSTIPIHVLTGHSQVESDDSRIPVRQIVGGGGAGRCYEAVGHSGTGSVRNRRESGLIALRSSWELRGTRRMFRVLYAQDRSSVPA